MVTLSESARERYGWLPPQKRQKAQDIHSYVVAGIVLGECCGRRHVRKGLWSSSKRHWTDQVAIAIGFREQAPSSIRWREGTEGAGREQISKDARAARGSGEMAAPLVTVARKNGQNAKALTGKALCADKFDDSGKRRLLSFFRRKPKWWMIE